MKKKTRITLTIILIAIAAVSIVYIAYYFTTQNKREEVYKDMKKTVAVQEKKEPAAKPAEEPKEENPIDFAQLQQNNPDIYAWISIPETNINYPILQSSTDNAYYLDHTVDYQAGLPGSIYTENHNLQDFSNFNTIIYGHDMLDGTMFQNLHNYEDMTYLQQHPNVYIYTPQKKLTYQIYHALVYDDRHILMSFDFTQTEQRQAYLDSLKAVRELGSNFNDDVQVDTNSRIITMSTCIGDRPNNRFLVGAVLIDEYEYATE